jgi:death-on-curing protein
MRNQWVWANSSVVYSIHEQQIGIYGGAAGFINESNVLSAVARPQNIDAYGEPDIADRAAAYAFGIANNHGFMDGNKRTAWVTAQFFLYINQVEMRIDTANAVQVMLAVAAGVMTESELAAWFREHIISSESTKS